MNIFFKNKGGSTVFEIIIAITLITFILFFPVIAFSLMHKKNLLADTLALGLQTISVEGGLTDRTEHVLLENLSAKGLLPESPTHPLRQRIRFESNADARGGQTQNLIYRDSADPKISFTIWYPADAEVSFINGLSRLIGANNQGVAFQTNVDGETAWYYRMGGYIFSERIEDTLMALPPPAVAPTAIITITPSTNILTTTSITFSDSLSTGSIVAREWQLNSGAVVASPPNGILLAGNHTIRLRVRDSNGLWSDWASRTFEVQAIPVAVLTMNPSTGLTTTTSIAFTHNTTSGGQNIIAAEWQRNSDAITTSPPNGAFTIGNHTVRLRVRNTGGIWSDWVQTNFSVVGHSFTMVEAGELFSVARRVDNTLWTWGNNSLGQLGSGTNTNRHSPAQVPGFTDITSVAAFSGHSLILRGNGTVWGSGANWSGQLGDGIPLHRNSFVQASGLTNITSISAGAHHSFAIDNAGSLWVWGNNSAGQLGDNTATDRSLPVQVFNLSNVVASAGGWSHSLALRNDGTVWAWGWNSSGQLGDGTFTGRRIPVQVSGLTNIIAIAAGHNHSYALRSDGTVWAWGFNARGELGDGTTTGRNTPVRVGTFTGAVAISSGSYHGLALLSNGTVMMWGAGGSGQLGEGATINRSTPILVPGLTGVISASAGGNHSLALRNDGTLWAWGLNGSGQFGNGTTTNSLVPILIPTP